MTMWTAVALALGAAAGALAFRIRGGLLTDRWPGFSGQLQRMVYALVFSTIVVVAGWPWPINSWRLPTLACTLPLAFWIGAVYCGTLGAIDSGRNEHSRSRDFAMNTLRGAMYMAPAAALVAAVCSAFGADHRAWMALVMVAGGALQGVAYEAAHTFFPMDKGHKSTEFAEFATGACMGLGAAASGLF